MKIGYLVAVLLMNMLVWMPSISLSGPVFDVHQEEAPIQKRKVLKPPPEKIAEKVKTKEAKAKKMPMPDMTPDEPEPIVEPDPPPEPEVLPTDDWEIGIPDGPPEPPADTIARVGQVGVEPPVFIKRVPPSYPERAIKIKLQGYVILEAILRKDGSVDDIKVLRGLGKGKFGFEDEAIQALKKWSFLPGKVSGRPADVRMTLKIDFVLQ
jgi:protein TonB